MIFNVLTSGSGVGVLGPANACIMLERPASPAREHIHRSLQLYIIHSGKEETVYIASYLLHTGTFLCLPLKYDLIHM